MSIRAGNRTVTSVSTLLLSCLLSLSPACSDDDDGGGGGDPTPEVSDTPTPAPTPDMTPATTPDTTPAMTPDVTQMATPVPTTTPPPEDAGRCVQCVEDADCQNVSPFQCGPGAGCVCTEGACVVPPGCNPPCADNQTCNLGGPAGGDWVCNDNCDGDEGSGSSTPCGGFFPYCRDNTNCVSCLTDDHCTGNAGGEACHPALNFCFMPCSTDADCEGMGQGNSCDVDSGVCSTRCRNDSDCDIQQSGDTCDLDSGECVCFDDDACRTPAGDPLPNLSGSCR